MSPPRYKNPQFQKMYDAMLAAAADCSSELYFEGRPHRGAGHRTAFWDGYAGIERSANAIPGTLRAVCFSAGKAFAKTNPGIPKEEATWLPGITKQGETNQ
ncbi:hypothetical protein [Cupriavidus sp. TMH.W2]|uniref:hypothetical protein n=1 Tax=Cupriavidus sp. TMH.W2 TaxID=3434465 RepID=UPI003D78495F